MSDVSKEPMRDKRMVELERVNNILLDRIQKYDRIEAQNKSLSERLDELSKLLSYHSQENKLSLQDLSQSLDSSRLSHNSLNDLFSSYTSHAQEKFNVIHSCFTEADAAFDVLEKTVNAVDLKHSKAQERFASKDHLDVMRDDHEDDIEDVKDQIQDVTDRISSLQEDFKDEKAYLSEHQADKDEQISSIETDIASIKSSLRYFEQRFLDMAEVSANKEKYFRELYDHAFRALREELISSPTAIEPVRLDLMDRLQGVSLDAKNALLKAGNSDSKTYLLEKKVENLALQIKKFELSE